jgi:hypothetical protein
MEIPYEIRIAFLADIIARCFAAERENNRAIDPSLAAVEEAFAAGRWPTEDELRAAWAFPLSHDSVYAYALAASRAANKEIRAAAGWAVYAAARAAEYRFQQAFDDAPALAILDAAKAAEVAKQTEFLMRLMDA